MRVWSLEFGSSGLGEGADVVDRMRGLDKRTCSVDCAQGRSDPIASEARQGKREGQEATYYNEALHEKITPNSYENTRRTCREIF